MLSPPAEGRVIGWGANGNGQTDVPSGLSNVVAIAVGGPWSDIPGQSPGYSLALMGQPTVPTPRLKLSQGMSGLELQVHGAPGISCQLLRAPDTSEAAQFYRLLRK
jgi:hypothetical protein